MYTMIINNMVQDSRDRIVDSQTEIPPFSSDQDAGSAPLGMVLASDGCGIDIYLLCQGGVLCTGCWLLHCGGEKKGSLYSLFD